MTSQETKPSTKPGPKPGKQTTQTTVTLMSQMIGASLLSFPQIIYNLGAIPSAILLIFTLLS